MKHEELLSKLTPEEKAALLSGKTVWQTRDIPRLKIPSIFLSDGPHGIRKQAGAGDHLGLNASLKATCFPTAATIANSWDPDLGEEIGKALGEEAAAQDVNIVLGPGLNMKRSPLCGRNFEYFSEDPYLAGKMAAAYVRGIQSQGVYACPKHFAVNSQEERRMAMDAVVDERTLREIYLTGFEIAVKEGHAKAIMTSYNEVNEEYANENNVDIIGDIPIYMGLDSSDVWADAGEFLLDENLTPVKVAGVPPDAFSELGQKWGNPLYDYDKMEANGFSWWRKRMAASAKLYDVIRIDHFIGIVKYYTIPADMPDARQGEYRQGPGQKLLDVINESIGDKKIIAEDLGVEVPEVAKILKENGYPGMKVLEFAFDSGEENDYLPHKYTENCVVYTGTHDNDTVMGWLETAKPEDISYARSYCQMPDDEPFNWGLIRVAYESKADTAIVPMQDILGLGKEARMNIPSTLGGNWVWRLDGAALTDELADKLKTMSEKSGRLED